MDKETLSEYKTLEVITEVPKNEPQKFSNLLFNGMIHPLKDFTIKGFLWYQGESNKDNPEEYAALFPAMIEQWRNQWGQEKLPFYFVQIAPFDYGSKNADFLREVQLKTMQTLKNTGMVVTLDIGDCKYIHPFEKRIVGERLAYWALSKNYGFDGIAFSGPVYQKMETNSDGKINLHFSYSENGLISFGKTLSGFEVSGHDKVFHTAIATVNRDGTVTVFSKMVQQPLAVRYAFESCLSATLFNIEGLPASSFRTDDWVEEN
tara:strand:- start:66 stop:851 length:786 start_codon:yes stop_codon:yes gene_type:complete